MNNNLIFANVFKEEWKILPTVIKKRYANRSYSNDEITVEGRLNMHCLWIMFLLKPFLWIFKALVPYRGKNIPVIVRFQSEPGSDILHFNRTFYLPNRKPYNFHSVMHILKENEVVEFMRFNIGWHMHCFYDGKKVIMQHKGYVWKAFGFLIPIPLSLIIGTGYAEEEAISDNEFRMYFEIKHRLFGKLYGYEGDFIIKE